jgi:cytochrome c556
MRPIVIFFAVLAAAFAAAQAADQSKENPTRTNSAAPPTHWDTRVTDTFFPDAYAALVGPRPDDLTAVMTGSAKKAAQTAGTTPGNRSLGTATDGAIPWSKLISADALQDEIKSLQPQLAEETKTQQTFLGGAYKKSRRTLSLLAAAFAIICEYDGDIRWKAQAPAVRNLFARSAYNCKASTDQTYRDVKQRSDDLATLLRGETLEAPAAESTNDWGKVADLLPLMARLELAQRDRIAPWTASSAEMKKNAAALDHEAEIVAALAKVISRPGMEYADDEKFRGFAKSLQTSALELRAAAENQNYDTARAAAGTLSKACANCHNDYR